MIYESVRKMTYKEQEAYDLGYLNGKGAALRGPQPDPITGLVPCGCGGKAHVYMPVSVYSLYIIGCERCRVRITFPNKVNEAKNEWNAAMGYKEADE